MRRKFVFDSPSLDELTQREWLVTNGIGGYASSSLCGANTRRYHGLLVASFQPPTNRKVIVSNVEELVSVNEKKFPLSTNFYPGAVFPEGYSFLKSFQPVPFPVSHFAFDEGQLRKSVFMRYGKNVTIVEYKNTSEVGLQLELMPLFVYRDYHYLFNKDERWTFQTNSIDAETIVIEPGEQIPPFYMRLTKGQFSQQSDWYNQFEYFREIERGLDCREDARSVGKVECRLEAGEKLFLVWGLSPDDIQGDPTEWKQEEKKRWRSLTPKGHTRFIKDLAISGNQFLVQRNSTHGHTIIAGYHWFTDWGRDTMIAMRGLVIAMRKKKLAKSILDTFLHYLDRGMIPNRFPDEGEQPAYNTIDATLWLFVVLYEYYEKFKDITYLRETFDKLTEILDAHIEGTRYNIHITDEGLLYGGDEGTQLTWMDAKVGDYVVTPRIGCPVEINALWYNALSIYVFFGKLLDQDVTEYEIMQKAFKKIFRKYFVNADGYLNDVVIPGHEPDTSIRPNQVYAVSLPFSPLTAQEARRVLRVMEEHLYTDYGLRSLSIHHPDFMPFFTGDPWNRDTAYHQGTVWAFLWGEYALAYMRLNKHSSASRQWVKDHVKTLEQHFYTEEGIWSISEVFDGKNPGPGKGCIQQAWSVGMTLMALIESENK